MMRRKHCHPDLDEIIETVRRSRGLPYTPRLKIVARRRLRNIAKLTGLRLGKEHVIEALYIAFKQVYGKKA